MKNVKRIIVSLLALLVFVLGAGTEMVHICSACCKTKSCPSSLHSCPSCSGTWCGGEYSSVDEDGSVGFTERCSCLTFFYNIDFFKISQDDDSADYVPSITDVPEFFSYNLFQYTETSLHDTTINAPPVKYGGRKLLVMNSILII